MFEVPHERSEAAARMEAALANNDGGVDLLADKEWPQERQPKRGAARTLRLLPRIGSKKRPSLFAKDPIERARSGLTNLPTDIAFSADGEERPILLTSPSTLSWHTVPYDAPAPVPSWWPEDGGPATAMGRVADRALKEVAAAKEAEIEAEDPPLWPVDLDEQSRSELSHKVLEGEEWGERDVTDEIVTNEVLDSLLASPAVCDGVEVEAANEEDAEQEEGEEMPRETVLAHGTGAESAAANVENETKPLNEPASKKDAGFALLRRRARRRTLLKKKTVAAPAAPSSSAAPAPATEGRADKSASRDGKLTALRSRVKMLGARRHKRHAGAPQELLLQKGHRRSSSHSTATVEPLNENEGQETPLAHVIVTPVKILADEQSNENEGQVTPVKETPLAHVIVTPVKILADEATDDIAKDGTPSTAASSLGEVPSGFTPSPDASMGGTALEGAELPPAMPSAVEANAFEVEDGVSDAASKYGSLGSFEAGRGTTDHSGGESGEKEGDAAPSETVVSLERQSSTCSVITVPDPGAAELSSPSPSMDEGEGGGGEGGEGMEGTEGVKEGSVGNIIEIRDVYENSHRLQALLARKEWEEADEAEEGGVEANEANDAPMDEAAWLEADTGNDNNAEAKDDGEDESIHIVCDTDGHGIIGTSADVLVEVSSVQGEEDVEVIQCLGLDEIGLENEASHGAENGAAKPDLSTTAETVSTGEVFAPVAAAKEPGTNPTDDPATPSSKRRASGRLVRIKVHRDKSSRKRFGRKKKPRASPPDIGATATENKVARTGLSTEAKEAVEEFESLGTPVVDRKLGEVEFVLTPVATPVQGTNQKHGLSAEAQAALDEEVEEIEVDEKRRVRRSQSAATPDDDDLLASLSLYSEEWDLDTLDADTTLGSDSRLSSFASERVDGGRCAFDPFGIPRDEIIEDLVDAFEDTTAHVLGIMGLDLPDNDPEVAKAHERRRGAVRKPSSRGRSSHGGRRRVIERQKRKADDASDEAVDQSVNHADDERRRSMPDLSLRRMEV